LKLRVANLPSHTNKGGARYRYYVSQAVLQKKPQAASIGRVLQQEFAVECLGCERLQNFDGFDPAYADYFPGVRAFVDELLAEGNWREVAQAGSMMLLRRRS
jgi:hypothetical protein